MRRLTGGALLLVILGIGSDLLQFLELVGVHLALLNGFDTLMVETLLGRHMRAWSMIEEEHALGEG